MIQKGNLIIRAMPYSFFKKFTLFRKIYDFIYKIDTLYHGLKHVKAYIFRNKVNF